MGEIMNTSIAMAKRKLLARFLQAIDETGDGPDARRFLVAARHLDHHQQQQQKGKKNGSDS